MHTPIRTICTLLALTLAAFGLTGGESSARAEPDVRAAMFNSAPPVTTPGLFSLQADRLGRWQTDRKPEASGEPYTVAVVSDMNGSYGSTSYTDKVHQSVDWLTDDLQPDLVVSTGDHVAGQRLGLDYAAMWEGFHETVTRPLDRAGIPFAPSPGNHDASAAPRYHRERARYEREWENNRPNVEFVDDRHFPFYYAFRAGPALFVAIDATMPGRLPDEQFAWLKSVLRRHDDATTKVVYGHLPLAPFARGKANEALESKRLERLLGRTDVEVMLSGHHHAYYPGRRGDLRLVGLGCLGAGPRALLGTDERSQKSAVVMQMYPDGRVQIEAHTGERMTTRIKRQSLPRSVGSGRWKVRRDDLGRRRPLSVGP